MYISPRFDMTVIPIVAAPLLPGIFTRDELGLIMRLMLDQKRNFGITPWIFEDANVQMTRFPLEDIGQLPGLVIYSGGERYTKFGGDGDTLFVDDPASELDGTEIVFEEDQYVFPVQFHIEMQRDQRLRIGYPDDANYIEAENADEGTVMIKNIIKMILRANFSYYDPDIPREQGEFGWSSLNIQDISWAASPDGIMAIDIFINFLFQNSFLPPGDFDPN